MIGDFRRVGNLLFMMHMVDASSGNLSTSVKDGIWITKTGVCLYNLRMKDIVKIGFEPDVRWNAASSEVEIHVNIYQKIKSAKAVLHAHPINTIKMSLRADIIKPVDYEGCAFLKSVDVLDIPYNNWGMAKQVIPQYFIEYNRNIVVARGHGVFVYADSLFNALKLASALEHSCSVLV